MPSPLALPKTFPTDPVALKATLERLSQELDAYLRQIAQTTEQTPALSLINPGSLIFGGVARVSVADGVTGAIQLPRPDAKMVGKKCTIQRLSTTGEILVYAVGCLVAGQQRYRMANDIHFVEFLFDGDFYPSRAGGGY